MKKKPNYALKIILVPLIITILVLLIIGVVSDKRENIMMNTKVENLVMHGNILLGDTTLLVRIKLEKLDSDGVTGFFEVPDQAAGVLYPIQNVIFTQNKLSFDVKDLGASFDGITTENKLGYDGSWIQNTMELPLALVKGDINPKQKYPDLDGIWEGNLPIDGYLAPFQFRFHTTEYGTAVVCHSPDFGINQIPLPEFDFVKEKISLKIPLINAVYDGHIDIDTGELIGQLDRPELASIKIDMKKLSDVEIKQRQARTQLGSAKYKDNAVDVQFPPTTAQLPTISGTIAVPEGAAPFPAFILVSGSGPQGRDGNLFGHSYFKVMSNYLVDKGYAVIRYDDRGVGKSEGSFVSSTTADFADDLITVINYLSKLDYIDQARIGVIGRHSEGSIVALIAANQEPKISHIVCMSCVGVGFDEILLKQNVQLFKAQQYEKGFINEASKIYRRIYLILKATGNQLDKQEKLRTFLTPDILEKLSLRDDEVDAFVSSLTSEWILYLINYDIQHENAALNTPVLAINGNLDRQLEGRRNLEVLEQSLPNNQKNKFILMQGLNHFLQKSETGAVGEYESLTETISFEVLNKIVEWEEKISDKN